MPDESRSTIYIIGAGFTGITIAAEIAAKKVFGRVVDQTGSFDLGFALVGLAPAVALVLLLLLWRHER